MVNTPEAWKIPQSIQFLLCNYEDPSLILEPMQKNSNMAVHASVPTSGEGGDRKIPGADWAANLA